MLTRLCMKKTIIILLSLILSCAASYGQKGRGYVGINLNLGTELEIPSGFDFRPGIKIKYGYEIVRRLYIEPNFNIFLRGGDTIWDINTDLTYKIYPGKKFNFYPIIGFTMAREKWKRWELTHKETQYGANFGIGFGYDVTDKWFVNVDFKYSTTDIDYEEAALAFGCGYRF